MSTVKQEHAIEAMTRLQQEFHSLCGEMINVRGVPEGTVFQVGLWTMVALMAELDGVEHTRAMADRALRAWQNLDSLEFAVAKGSA